MEDLQAQFESAAEAVKSFSSKPSNDNLLKIYALYKQATVGDINTSKVGSCSSLTQPGMFDQKGRAKWSAWEKNKGMSQDDAKKEYIALVDSLK